MARKLGLGGIANTEGERTFTGKALRGDQAARRLGLGGLGNTLGARDFSGRATQVPGIFIPFLQRSNIRSLLGR